MLEMAGCIAWAVLQLLCDALREQDSCRSWPNPRETEHHRARTSSHQAALKPCVTQLCPEMQPKTKAQPDNPRGENWRLILTSVTLVELCRDVTQTSHCLTFHRWRAARPHSAFPCWHCLGACITMKFCCLFLALELWHSNTHLPPRPPWSQSHPALPSLSRAEDPAPSCLSWLRTHHCPLSHHAAPSASQPAHLLVAMTPLCPPATSSSSSCCSCFWTCFLSLFSFPSLPVHLVLVPPSCWCSPPCHPCSSTVFLQKFRNWG